MLGTSKSTQQPTQAKKEQISPPLPVRMIDFLGLSHFLIERFLFNRKHKSNIVHDTGYHIARQAGYNVIVGEEVTIPEGYSSQT